MEKLYRLLKKESTPHSVKTHSLKEAIKLHKEGQPEVILYTKPGDAQNITVPKKGTSKHRGESNHQDKKEHHRMEFMATDVIQTIPDHQDPIADAILQWFLYGGDPPLDHTAIPDSAKQPELSEEGAIIFPGVIKAIQSKTEPEDD